MAFTESLTVRILGDSSQLQEELQTAADAIGRMQQQLEQAATGGERIGRSLSRISMALRPLQQVSQLLTRITTQVQTLSSTAVNLNVQPALQALQQLSQAIAAVAAQLQTLGPVRGGPPPGAPPPVMPPAGPIRQFARGGPVVGLPGLDRIPALLTAGEYVLSRGASRALGLPFLNALNTSGGRVAARDRATGRPAVIAPSMAVAAPLGGSPPPASLPSTTNHFGGITIQVRETADVNALVRDLRLQGIHLRNRRG